MIKKIIIPIILIFIVINCKSLKKTSEISENYKGIIKQLNDEKINLRYNLKINDLRNINIKLYGNYGIKICDLIISNDSIKVNYLINNSYENDIINYYKSFNNKICIKNLLLDILNAKVYKNVNVRGNNENCYVIEKTENNDNFLILTNEKIIFLKIYLVKKNIRSQKIVFELNNNLKFEASIIKK